MQNKNLELRQKRSNAFKELEVMRNSLDIRSMSHSDQKRYDEKIKEVESYTAQISQQEQFAKIESRQEQNTATHKPATKEEIDYRTLFCNYLRNGNTITAEVRSELEKRSGISGLNGGVIIPKSLEKNIEIALKSNGGIFEVADVIQTAGGGDLTMPTINSTDVKAEIIGEYETSRKETLSFGAVTLKAFTYRTPILPMSIELLEDAGDGLDSVMTKVLADSFWRGANADMTNGDGDKMPQGVVAAAHPCNYKAEKNKITADDLLSMLSELDSNYAQKAIWMFNSATYYELRKLKDANGRYLWEEKPTNGVPMSLLGRQFVINDDMEDIGAGNCSVLLGDFSKYKIRIVSDCRVIRLNELLAEYLSVGIMGFARLDGRLLDAGTHPILKLQHKAD